MATELDHSFTTDKSIDDNFEAITDLERVVPAVEGGRVIERDRAGLGQGRDPDEDGGDVDEDRSAPSRWSRRTPTPTARCCG